MNRALKSCLVFSTVALLTACLGGGGDDDPADMYVGSWKTNCFSYVAVDGNTYFLTYTFTLAKASATSLAGSHSDSVAHSDAACKNILGAIKDDGNITIQLGEKANVLGGQVDKMTLTSGSEARPGYITANATQLFTVVVDQPGQIPGGWGRASPYTKIASKHASGSPVTRAGNAANLAPVDRMNALSN